VVGFSVAQVKCVIDVKIDVKIALYIPVPSSSPAPLDSPPPLFVPSQQWRTVAFLTGGTEHTGTAREMRASVRLLWGYYLLHCIHHNIPNNCDLLFLPKPDNASDRLALNCWIPLRFQDVDSIRDTQV
jgi:hypothetical protein